MQAPIQALDTLSHVELVELRKRIDNALSEHGDTTRREPAMERQACRLFTVADGVPWLDRHQLEKLTQAFEAWVEAARDSRARRSRERVFIVYLLLRYTGAKPGEILALDEREHFDFLHNTVHIAEDGKSREVPLPVEVIGRIREYCAKYGLSGEHEHASGEKLFELDQGFLRRKFHDQEKRSGLPKELLSPRVLRNSRAIELLQGGMPMRAVQALLGHGKADITASYVKLADDDLRHIIHHHCIKEFGMGTSARNTFHGDVIKVAANEVMCEVTLKTDSGYEVVAIITNPSREKLGLVEGSRATALVKASWVILEKSESPSPTSARNAFPGTITGVKSDDVVAEVTGTLDDGTPVCALVTAGSFNSLGIGQGDKFIFMFKAMSVIVS